jgi:hypothetical protein
MGGRVVDGHPVCVRFGGNRFERTEADSAEGEVFERIEVFVVRDVRQKRSAEIRLRDDLEKTGLQVETPAGQTPAVKRRASRENQKDTPGDPAAEGKDAAPCARRIHPARATPALPDRGLADLFSAG